MPKQIQENIIQEILERYTTDNISIKNLSKEFNLNPGTIRKYLIKNEIKIKTFSEQKLTPEVINTIIKMYEDGNSEQVIEDNIHICRTTIRKVLKQNGVQTKDQSQYRTYEVDENYFEKLDTNNKVYVLGFLYADGNVSKEKYNLQLSLQEGDKEILEKISKDMKSNKPLGFRNFKKYNYKTGLKTQNQWCLTIHNRKIHQDLSKWGIVPQKTHIINYPDFLKDNQHSHFLRGIIDGDGCIHPYSYTEHTCSVDINGTYNFCLGAKKIIEKFINIHCSLFKTARNGTTYRISISGKNQVSKFLDWVYKDADLYLKRKYELYLQYYCDKVA